MHSWHKLGLLRLRSHAASTHVQVEAFVMLGQAARHCGVPLQQGGPLYIPTSPYPLVDNLHCFPKFTVYP